MSRNPVLVYDRADESLVSEPILGDCWMRLAYSFPVRPVARRTLFRYSVFSRLMGLYADSRLSRRKIAKTIESLGIDASEFEKAPGDFCTFNDFFTRRLKPECRPYDAAPEALCAPADSRVACCRKLTPGTAFEIKGMRFDLRRLFGDPGESYVQMFEGGDAVVCRLSPADCHRYAFPVASRILKNWRLDGRLDSVNPVALRLGFPIFEENRREISILDGRRFGIVAYIEIGAFAVGGIVQTYGGIEVAKMQEKGYFEFGGSTIVLLFQEGKVQMDDDLIAHSNDGYETIVKMGERIGRLA